MDRGNVNPTAFALMTQEIYKKNPNHFDQQRNLNSEHFEYESSVNFDRLYALCIEKLSQIATSQSAGARIRASNFNRCNNATVGTREVLLVHALCDVITLSRTRSRFTQ